MNQKLIEYLQQQIRTTDDRLKRFTHDRNGKKRPKRFMFVKLRQYLLDFLAKKSEAKMVIVPGFRGVGKTTLVAQTCAEHKAKFDKFLFISIEDVREKCVGGFGITEIMSAYEEIIGEYLESVKKPILMFLDEVQSDPKWAISLKCLFDKTTNVFFLCTGSSAVVLQNTPNLARRAMLETMPPMCFLEFQMTRTKKHVYPDPGLKEAIRQAVYFSADAHEVHERLSTLKTSVNQYWSKASRMSVLPYLYCGTLPFAFNISNAADVYDAISTLIDKIITEDLPPLGKFSNRTLSVIKSILFIIAEHDTTSLNKLAEKINIHRITLAEVFRALEQAELLIKIPPYGSNMSEVKKPSKYLFMSPAIRMSFFLFPGRKEPL